ncbi:MAG: BlaI/MecI/CopY family transcriptional regulator [Rikenellaceae bacterium]
MTKITTKELTKAEMEIMQVFWKNGAMFLSELIDDVPEPRPAYTTISTIVRILVSKEFVGYTKYGRNFQYYPLISKEDYAQQALNRVKLNFFGNSTSSMISFFAKKEKLSKEEMEELRELIEQED